MPKTPQTEINKRLRKARIEAGWLEVRTWVHSKQAKKRLLAIYPPPTLADLAPLLKERKK